MKLKGKYIDDIFISNSGTGDGATVTYTLSNTPHSQTSIDVFLNGIRQKLTTDYSVNLGAPSITFTTAPANAQEIVITYPKV